MKLLTAVMLMLALSAVPAWALICDQCKAENKTSTVSGGWGSSTLMASTPYYDEKGDYHYHDPNHTIAEYSCSNGHVFTMSFVGKCKSCDYGSEEPKQTPVKKEVKVSGNLITGGDGDTNWMSLKDAKAGTVLRSTGSNTWEFVKPKKLKKGKKQ